MQNASLTKLDVLAQICEQPGWQPPHNGSSIDRWLEELTREGWIGRGLDGFHASSAALDCYPNFYEDDEGTVGGVQTIGTAPSRAAGGEPVSFERTRRLIQALLYRLPLPQVEEVVNLALSAQELSDTTDGPAQALASRLRG